MARLVSLDVGNGFVKYTSSSAPDGGYFPSVYAMEEPGIEFEGLVQSNDFVIGLDGLRYAIGWSARKLGTIPVRTLDRTRVLAPDYRILFAAALVAATGQGGAIAPVMSLPVSWYDRRDQVKAHLAGAYDVTCEGRNYHFDIAPDAFRIVPEGFGSICSLALDRSGRAHHNGLLRMSVGVCDMGTKTLDLTLFDELQYIPAKTQGYQQGVGLQAVYDIMRRALEREYGYVFTYEQLDAFLIGERSLHVGADAIDEAADLVKFQALEQVSNAIAGHINTLWQGGQDVQKILLTGGGAGHVLGYLSQRFPHLEPVVNPPMANCLGAYNYGVMRESAG